MTACTGPFGVVFRISAISTNFCPADAPAGACATPLSDAVVRATPNATAAPAASPVPRNSRRVTPPSVAQAVPFPSSTMIPLQLWLRVDRDRARFGGVQGAQVVQRVRDGDGDRAG